MILAAEKPPSVAWDRWARHLSSCAVCYRAEDEAGCCTAGQRLIFEAAGGAPSEAVAPSPATDWRHVPERALYVAAAERLEASAAHPAGSESCTCPTHRLAHELRDFLRRYVP